MHTYTPIFEQFSNTWAASKAVVDTQLAGSRAKRWTTNGTAAIVGGGLGAAAGLGGVAWGGFDSLRDIVADPKGSLKGFAQRGLGGLLIGLPLYGVATYAGLDPITSAVAVGLVETGVVLSPWASNAGRAFGNLVKGAYNCVGTHIGRLLTRNQEMPAPAVAPSAPNGFDSQTNGFESGPVEQTPATAYATVNNPPAEWNDPNGPVYRDPITKQPFFAQPAEPETLARDGGQQTHDDEFPSHPDADRREQGEQPALNFATAEQDRRTNEDFNALVDNARNLGLTSEGRSPEQRINGAVDDLHNVLRDLEAMGPVDPAAPEAASVVAPSAEPAPSPRNIDHIALSAVADGLGLPLEAPSAYGVAQDVLAGSPVPPVVAKAAAEPAPVAKADKPARVRKPRKKREAVTTTATAPSAAADEPKAATTKPRVSLTAGKAFPQEQVNRFYYEQLAAKADQSAQTVHQLAQRVDQYAARLDALLGEKESMRVRFGAREEGAPIPRPPRKPRKKAEPKVKAEGRVPHAAATVQSKISAAPAPAPAPADVPRMPKAAQLVVAPVVDDVANIVAPSRVIAPVEGPFIPAAPPQGAQEHWGPVAGRNQMRREPFIDPSAVATPNDDRSEPYFGPRPSAPMAPSAAERYAQLTHNMPITAIASPRQVPAEFGQDVYEHNEPVAPAAAPSSAPDLASPIAFRIR